MALPYCRSFYWLWKIPETFSSLYLSHHCQGMISWTFLEKKEKKKKVVFVSIWSMRLSTSLLKALTESFNLLVLRRKSSRFHSKPSVLPQSPLAHRKSHGVLTQVFSTKAAFSLRVARSLWRWKEANPWKFSGDALQEKANANCVILHWLAAAFKKLNYDFT